MRIGFDVDGVFADFNSAYITKVVEITGRDLFPPRPFDVPCWDYPEYYGYSRKEIAAIWENIKQSPTFWYELEPYPNLYSAITAINRLDKSKHDIYFVTSRPGDGAKQQTEDWLYDQWFRRSTVLISSEKALVCKALRLDHYIDDNVENVFAVYQHTNTQVVALTRPWNAGFNLPDRVATVDEFLQRIGV